MNFTELAPSGTRTNSITKTNDGTKVSEVSTYCCVHVSQNLLVAFYPQNRCCQRQRTMEKPGLWELGIASGTQSALLDTVVPTRDFSKPRHSRQHFPPKKRGIRLELVPGSTPLP